MRKRVVSNKSMASDQATLKITRAEYARYEALNRLGNLYWHLNTFLPILPLYRRVAGGFRWHHLRERFMYGDINPAVIVDGQAGLVAAYTDLDTKVQKRFPVINIFVEKLNRLPSLPSDGDTFAAVSLYGGDGYTKRTQRWHTFHPVVIDCVVRDQARCEFRKAMIPDAQWKALALGLSQIPDKTRPGIYDITLPDELKAIL